MIYATILRIVPARLDAGRDRLLSGACDHERDPSHPDHRSLHPGQSSTRERKAETHARIKQSALKGMISRRVTLVRYAGTFPFRKRRFLTRVKGRDIHDDSIQYIRHLPNLDRAHSRTRRLPPAS